MSFINKEIIAMLELMDKSPKVNRFLWAVLAVVFVLLLVYLSPSLIRALMEWKQATGG